MYNNLKESILKEYPRLNADETFKFSCHKAIGCFNSCCADVNILLTPYDVLRMKKALHLSSEDFLGEYTVPLLSVGQKFPLILLKMKDDAAKTCPFVGPQGCTIYTDRPWPCRMFPVGMASSKTEQRPDGEEFYFLMKEEGFPCLGFQEDREWTLAEWWGAQEIDVYNEKSSPFKDFTLHRKLQGEGTTGLEPAEMNIMHMALYDIDRFRDHLFNSKFFSLFEIDEDLINNIKDDDEALLDFGYKWLRFCLFREPTISIRSNVAEKRRDEMAKEIERIRGKHE